MSGIRRDPDGYPAPRDHAGAGAQSPCFAAGTRIMTAHGEVPVQALRPGDLLVTLGLQGPWLRPLAWLGQRDVDCGRHPCPDLVRPVRLAPGCLGGGAPHRALRLSPDHGLLLDGVLVPARALLDGEAVVQEPAGPVRYFHVEFDAHDILLAEGAAAESWLDCGNRGLFDNAAAPLRLHPDFTTPALAGGCAERVTAGPRVEEIRAALAAARRGHGTGMSPDGTANAYQ